MDEVIEKFKRENSKGKKQSGGISFCFLVFHARPVG